MMWMAVGFFSVLLPSLAFLVIRGAKQAKEYEIAKAEQQAERQFQREQFRAYRQMCKEKGLSVPLSTDEFYDRFRSEGRD